MIRENIICYHHINKTGGTSILKWIRKNYKESENNDIVFYNDDTTIIYNHTVRIDILCSRLNLNLLDPKIKHIISVRDPIDRFFSQLYQNFLEHRPVSCNCASSISKDPDISIDDKTQKQGGWLYNNRDSLKNIKPIFIRRENLNNDFQKAFNTKDKLQISNSFIERYERHYKSYSGFSLLKDWDSMNEDEKNQIRKMVDNDYEMLKSFGIVYNKR